MSSNNTIENLTETWAGVQRQSWGTWLHGFGLGDVPWEQPRKRTLALAEELTKNCLKAEIDWVKAAMNWVTWNDRESLLDQVTQNMRGMVDSCVKLQQQNCESWFKAMQETNPFPSSPFEPWQKAAEQMLEAQAGFISVLMPKGTKSEIPQRAPPVRKERADAQAAA